MRSFLIAAAVTFACAPALAAGGGQQDRYWERKADGWHFYEPDPPPPPEKPEPVPPELVTQSPAAPNIEEPAVLSSAWIRENLEHFRDRAIDDPTPENVELVAYLQRLATDRAERFSQVWTRVVQSNPALDETARSPISAIQQTAARAQMSVAKREAMAKITQRAGLWYFFLSTCPYCMQQEPILERMQADTGMSILPISLDGGAPPTWGDVPYVVNQGQAQELGVMVTPTLVVADTITGELYNLAAGLRTNQEIEERLLEMAVTNGWITEIEYENAVRGEPRRFLAEGLPEGWTPSDDPNDLLHVLREASVTGGSSEWVVPPQPGVQQ